MLSQRYIQSYVRSVISKFLFYLTIRKDYQRWWKTLWIYDEYFQTFELGIWSKLKYLMGVKNSNDVVYRCWGTDESKPFLLWSGADRIFNHKIEIQKHRKERSNAANIILKISKKSLPPIKSQENLDWSRRISNKKFMLYHPMEHLWISKNFRPPVKPKSLHLRPQKRA